MSQQFRGHSLCESGMDDLFKPFSRAGRMGSVGNAGECSSCPNQRAMPLALEPETE